MIPKLGRAIDAVDVISVAAASVEQGRRGVHLLLRR